MASLRSGTAYMDSDNVSDINTYESSHEYPYQCSHKLANFSTIR